MLDSKKTTDKLKRQLENVRRRKIAKMKSRIGSGSYRVSSEAVAKALLLTG